MESRMRIEDKSGREASVGGYDASPSGLAGEAARAAAEAGSKEKEGKARALKAMRSAAAEGDLLHPRLWDTWAFVEDGLFERAAAMLSVEELKKLGSATDISGRGWPAGFNTARKLRALAARGLDPSAPICDTAGGKADAATQCCWSGEIGPLARMAEAGFAPPGEISKEAAEARSPELEPHTPLQLLAMSFLVDVKISAGGGEKIKRVISWLSSDGLGVESVNGNGDDALKLALRSHAPRMAQALLDCGARPEDKNKRGQSALDMLEEELAGAEAAAQAGFSEVERMRALRGQMLAAMEAKELAAISASASPARLTSPRSRM